MLNCSQIGFGLLEFHFSWLTNLANSINSHCLQRALWKSSGEIIIYGANQVIQAYWSQARLFHQELPDAFHSNLPQSLETLYTQSLAYFLIAQERFVQLCFCLLDGHPCTWRRGPCTTLDPSQTCTCSQQRTPRRPGYRDWLWEQWWHQTCNKHTSQF